MKPKIYITAALCAVLSACGGGGTDLKESLGITHNAPDEFQVFQRPPLTVPPEFNLRPPTNGPEYSAGKPSDQVAHDKVLGTPSTTNLTPVSTANGVVSNTPVTSVLPAGSAPNSPFVTPEPTGTPAPVTSVSSSALPSGADSQFLNDVGASKADPMIRQKIHDERNTSITPESQYLIDTKASGDPLVDPTKEADRLKQDKSQNLPPTTGDTPVIKPVDKGLLGTIF